MDSAEVAQVGRRLLVPLAAWQLQRPRPARQRLVLQLLPRPCFVVLVLFALVIWAEAGAVFLLDTR